VAECILEKKYKALEKAKILVRDIIVQVRSRPIIIGTGAMLTW